MNYIKIGARITVIVNFNLLFHSLNSKNFISEMRKRYQVKRHCKQGNEVLGIDLIENRNYY